MNYINYNKQTDRFETYTKDGVLVEAPNVETLLIRVHKHENNVSFIWDS